MKALRRILVAPTLATRVGVLWGVTGLALIPRPLHARQSQVELCPEYALTDPIDPPLTDTEKRLVCGDQSQAEQKSEGWLTVPKNQALFNIRNFLQSRGYLNPSIEEVDGDKSVRVRPGSIVHASGIKVQADPEISKLLDVTRKRRVLGQPLNRDLLDSIETWAHHELARGGYPCASIQGAADPNDGRIVLKIVPGDRMTIDSVRLLDAHGLDPGVLRRFDAFNPGEPYNSDLLAISADRTITDGVVERAYFVPLCAGEPRNTVQEEVVLGQSRIFTAGLSVNTEEVSVGRVSLKRVRLGANASSATLEARASFKVQQLTAFFDWRVGAPSAPYSLRPLLGLRHENEIPFEVYSERIQLGYVTQWDIAGFGLGLTVGPELEYFQSRRGIAPRQSHALALSTELRLVSHDYEFNRVKQAGGYRFTLSGRWNNEDWASSFGASRIRARGELVWNVGGYDPPALLVALRAGYAATVPQRGTQGSNELPANYREYLGGLSDLRGFSRLEIPGGLGSAFTGLELRPDLFGGNVEPLAFVDLGGIGGSSYFPSGPLYWSPGAGVSWSSPVGSLRATLAHGFISGGGNLPERSALSHWQFYLTLGEPL